MRDKSRPRAANASSAGQIELTCACCGKPFPVAVPKYCSIECYHETIRSAPITERCVVCGGPIPGRPNSHRVNGQRTYCSTACYAARPPRPVPVLFYARVDLNSDAPCHRWTGAANPRSGHGVFHTDRGTRPAHRVAYALWHGDDIPPVLHHECGNPWCVYPAHLAPFATQAAHRRAHARGQWSLAHDACVLCGRSDSPHRSKGRCQRCYRQLRAAEHS